MNKLITLTAAVVLMLSLAACGAKTDAGSSAAGAAAGTAADPNAQQLKIEASNWKFDQPEYHVKMGQPVTITFASKQGMHSAEISDFNVKLDSNNKTATFTPDKTGSHVIRCMIPCGEGHVNMTAKLIVD